MTASSPSVIAPTTLSATSETTFDTASPIFVATSAIASAMSLKASPNCSNPLPIDSKPSPIAAIPFIACFPASSKASPKPLFILLYIPPVAKSNAPFKASNTPSKAPPDIAETADDIALTGLQHQSKSPNLSIFLIVLRLI